MTKIVLITGATSGIGKATALLLAKNGYRLILTGRRKERLEELKKEISGEICTLCFDVTKSVEVENALKSLPSEWKNIDVLINNAGKAIGIDELASGDITEWGKMIDTNIKGLLYVTRLILPGMKERKSGHIINLSSIAGKETYPGGSIYCATKHAVNAISDSMRVELLPYSIKVSTISPGAVETEFSVVRFRGDRKKADNVYRGLTPLYAKDIAECIYFIISRPENVTIADIKVLAGAQASARDFYRKEK
ncbi:MAG: SDR family oxidoreductase [Prolixibacteraceae bacterium]|nr:SDR family oxidoreductase [Prolixibacteraceae bacterium]